MRILMVTESSTHGVGLHVINLTQMLSQHGHEVHLIYSPKRIDHIFQNGLSQLHNCHTIPLEMERNPCPQDYRCIKFIREYIKKQGPFDIIHGHSSKGGALIRLAGMGLYGAKVYTPNAMVTLNPTLPRWKKSIYSLAEWILGYITDVFIAVSEEEAHEARRIGFPPNKIIIIPNGIETPNLPDRRATRTRLNLAEDEIVIGFVGRLSPQKGPEILIQAMNILIDQFRNHKLILVIVGDGELRGKLQEMVKKLQIDDRVRWVGETQGVLQMPAFDLLAFPSLYEGMPYVLMEALFAALPIVASQVGGAKMMVESNVNGYLVPPRDPESLAIALGELIADPAKRLKFGIASLKKSQLFTIANMISTTESVYEAISVRHKIE